MRPNIVVLSFLCLISFNLFSQPVDIETIKLVAKNANQVLKNEIDKNVEITEILPISEKETDIGYIINFNDNSFLILSGDYSIKPILGHCNESKFSFNEAPPGLKYLLARYEAEIKYARDNSIKPSAKTKKQWESMLNVPRINGSLKSAVSPLISTKWTQRSGYNQYCPYDSGTGLNCPAGCTAVALAQILKKWECRVNAQGSHSYSSDYGLEAANFGASTYDWVDMENTFANSESAWLIYSAGVGMDMDYGGSSSTALPWNAENSLKDYWGFVDDTECKWRISHIFTWKDDLQDDLDDGRPILYSGGNVSGGHSWVIDGYNDDDEFHCVWGWNSGDDGYYSLGGFNPGSYNFNQFESAIFNAEPERTTGLEQPDISPQTMYPGSVFINHSACDGATFYSWTATNGSITATKTTRGNILTTSVNSEVCVRSFNTLCDIYSDWDCETFTIITGPITGDNIVCYNTNKTYNLSNCPTGASVSWSKSSRLSWVGTPSGTSCTVRALSSSTFGAGWVKATVTNTDNTVLYVTKNVWVGKFESTAVTGTAPVCPNSSYNYSASVPGGYSASYSWTYPSGWSVGSQYSNNIQLYTPQYTMTYGTVRAAITNVCGTSGYSGMTVYPGYNCGGYYMASPNPGSEYLELNTAMNESGNLKAVSSDLDITVKVFNSLGALQYSSKLNSLPYRLDTSMLPDGNYIFQIIDKNNVESISIIIRH